MGTQGSKVNLQRNHRATRRSSRLKPCACSNKARRAARNQLYKWQEDKKNGNDLFIPNCKQVSDQENRSVRFASLP